MDTSTLEFTIRELPKFVPELVWFPDFDAILDAIWDCHDLWPEYVSKPRKLVPTADGNWVYVVTLGHGPLHQIVDLLPHGGELYWLVAATEYTMFMCEHPWLLEDRTIMLLFTGPDEAIRNLEGWATTAIAAHRFGYHNYLRRVFRNSFRDPAPTHNHDWSWPLRLGKYYHASPTSGALAGMMLVRELAAARQVNPSIDLLLWVAGHCQVIWYATQFHVDGPGDQSSALASEKLARRMRIRLDPGPAEIVAMRRHPGTIASWHNWSGAEHLATYQNAAVGARPFEWSRRYFPDLCVTQCEAAMLSPVAEGPWDQQLSVDEARSRSRNQRQFIDQDLQPLLELAHLLPECDPYVTATRGLAVPGHGWGEPAEDTRPGGLILSRSEGFRELCVGPLYAARGASVACEMVLRNLDLARSVWKGRDDPLFLSMMLSESITLLVRNWWLYLAPQSLRKAVILSILTAEIAFYGTQGIRPRFR